MASNTPVPDFVSGQALLARDFAALVGAVRDLMQGQMPTLEQPRAGRYYRPFVIAGTCIPRAGADDEPVAGVAEVLFQVGEHVTLCADATVAGLPEELATAREKQVPCGLHAAIAWDYLGGWEHYTLRATGMQCAAAAWLPPEVQDDGSYTYAGWHGGTVFSVVMPTANTRGQLQCTPVPWVMPQHPAMVWRSANGDYMAELLTGEMCLLPSPAEEAQLLAVSGGGYYKADNTYHTVRHEWRGRLDKHGVLHMSTRNDLQE
jgi:hypothetical protein